jgi:hypothetical protein
MISFVSSLDCSITSQYSAMHILSILRKVLHCSTIGRLGIFQKTSFSDTKE